MEPSRSLPARDLAEDLELNPERDNPPVLAGRILKGECRLNSYRIIKISLSPKCVHLALSALRVPHLLQYRFDILPPVKYVRLAFHRATTVSFLACHDLYPRRVPDIALAAPESKQATARR